MADRKIDATQEVEIFKARRALKVCENEEAEAAEAHKAAKKATEAAQLDLNSMIDECENPGMFSGSGA